jgi:hypothetical protein
MLLLAAALALLLWGFLWRGGRIGPRLRRRLLVVSILTLGGVLLTQLLRMGPAGLVVLLVGVGVGVNAFLRERGEAADETPEDAPARPQAPAMGRSEALAVLGLSGEPGRDAIEAAHRRMIVRAHPDQGGSNYLASKVNEAREVLLRN